MKDIIKTILYDWKSRKLPESFDREQNLSDFVNLKQNKIITVSGFRRVGKTFMLFNLIKNLLKDYSREEIVYINFEDERIPQKTEFLSLLIPTSNEIFEKKIKFLFLDEVQNMPEWSKWLRRMYDTEKISYFVSGSSSKLSSIEIPTELRGRSLDISSYPLSLKEFLVFKEANFDFKTISHSEDEKSRFLKLFNEYIIYGALPEIVLSDISKKFEIAQSYYKTVVSRDIIERYKIKNEEGLKALIKLLLNSKEYSISRIYNNMKGLGYEIGKTTIQHYLSYIENSFFCFSLPIFSYKIKDQIQYSRKIYFIDNSFISSISTKFSKNYGRLYENIVALELLRKNNEFYYWKDPDHNEVDFIVKKSDKVNQLIQVCYDVSSFETKKREIRSLLKAGKELKCKNLLIITSDEDKEEMAEWFGFKSKIKFIPLWKWLLENE